MPPKGYYERCEIAKPEPRARVKRRKRRLLSEHVREVREYVFLREGHVCRICGVRPAQSMHEIRPRSLGGKVSRENSIAVCGDGVQGCHGYCQRHEIHVAGNAESLLVTSVATDAARRWVGWEERYEQVTP
jgi:hypothetical protein